MKARHLLPALIAFAAATASPANAALIYSGVQNVAVPVSFDGVYLRMSDGTVQGTDPGVTAWATEPWINPFFGGVYIGNSDLLRPVVLGIGANPEQIVNLASGSTIGLGSNFVAAASGSTTHVGAAANQFQIGTPGLIGFTFKTAPASADYYGWLRLNVDNSVAGSIVDWAYDNTAGTAVQAGVLPVPEPAEAARIALFALPAVCAIFRRRRSAACA